MQLLKKRSQGQKGRYSASVDPTPVLATHTRVITVIPLKTILEYGGVDRLIIYFLFRLVFYFFGFNFFSPSWQVRARCNSVSGSVTSWVQLSMANMTNVNVQYHNFCAIMTNQPPIYWISLEWNLDPEPLNVVLLCEGAWQHNMDKVYSGLYECMGHVVPYLRSSRLASQWRLCPGNRRKRDCSRNVCCS